MATLLSPVSFLRTRNRGEPEVSSERQGADVKQHDAPTNTEHCTTARTLRNRAVGLDIAGEQYLIPPPKAFARLRGRANNWSMATPKTLDREDPRTKAISRRVHHLAIGIAISLEIKHLESSAARPQGVRGPVHAGEKPTSGKTTSLSRSSVSDGEKSAADSGSDSYFLLCEWSMGSNGPVTSRDSGLMG